MYAKFKKSEAKSLFLVGCGCSGSGKTHKLIGGLENKILVYGIVMELYRLKIKEVPSDKQELQLHISEFYQNEIVENATTTMTIRDETTLISNRPWQLLY
jgi:hypothetical protein